MTKSFSQSNKNQVSDTNAVAAWAVPEPGEFDVICAKGGKANNHKGNKLYLRHRDALRESYLRTSKRREKNRITDELVSGVHERGGQFRVYCPRTKLWMILDPVRTHTKAGQALRECFTAEERKQKRDRYKKCKTEGYSSSSSEQDDCTSDESIDNNCKLRKHERSCASPLPQAKRTKPNCRPSLNAVDESLSNENNGQVNVESFNEPVEVLPRKDSQAQITSIPKSVVTEDDEDEDASSQERSDVEVVFSEDNCFPRPRPSLYRDQSGSSAGSFIHEFDSACVEFLVEALVEDTQGREKVTAAAFDDYRGHFEDFCFREDHTVNYCDKNEFFDESRRTGRDFGFGKSPLPSFIVYEV